MDYDPKGSVTYMSSECSVRVALNRSVNIDVSMMPIVKFRCLKRYMAAEMGKPCSSNKLLKIIAQDTAAHLDEITKSKCVRKITIDKKFLNINLQLNKTSPWAAQATIRTFLFDKYRIDASDKPHIGG